MFTVVLGVVLLGVIAFFWKVIRSGESSDPRPGDRDDLTRVRTTASSSDPVFDAGTGTMLGIVGWESGASPEDADRGDGSADGSDDRGDSCDAGDSGASGDWVDSGGSDSCDQ
jgi:hypothetical protein